jgi:hypothetical protein
LCKNGYRVLLIEEESDNRKNQPFSDEDTTTFISGCAPNRLLYNLFRELNISIHHQKKFKAEGLPYQIAMPECRLDVGNSWKLYHQEVKREFFNDVAAIEHLYDEVFKCDKLLNEIFYNYLLCPQNLSSKLKSNFVMYLENVFKINEENRDFSETMLQDFKNPSFKDILILQANLLSNLSSDDLNMTTLFLLGSFQRGISQQSSRPSDLKQILRTQIIATHGEFLKIKEIESIRVTRGNPLKHKKGISIKIKDENKVVDSRFMVYGQSLSFLPNVLKTKWISGSLKKLIKRLAPKSAKLTFAYKIDKWGIPAGFRSRVFFVPGKHNKKKKEVLVSISPEINTNPDEPCYILKGTIREPFRNGTIKGIRVKEVYDEVTVYLKELTPFYDDFVTPAENQRFNDIKSSELKYGDFVFDSSFLKNLSLGEVQSCEILKNIYFTGREFLPQLGFEGEIISGWRTANVIVNKFKSKKMF